MSDAKEITLPIEWRSYQNELRHAMKTKKRAIIVYHRRAGKDLACWNIMLIEALKRKGIYYYVLPTYRQARRAIWEAMDHEGRKFIDYIPRELLASRPNNTEMKIDLQGGSIIRLIGSDDFDAIRGTNPVGVVFSEFAYQKPEIWSLVVEPTLRMNAGWAIFNSTPYGKNHFFELWNTAQRNPDVWYSKLMTVKDTGLVSQKELDELYENGISQETIQQEYMCSWDRGVEGSYYGRILHQIREAGHIRNIVPDDYARVYTACDIGIGDSTSVWWFQVVNNEIRFLDYYENSGEPLIHYIRIIEERGQKYNYRYAEHFAPHDICQRELGTGTTRLLIAADAGLKFTVLPMSPVDLGIELTRKLLRTSYFDQTKCKKGIEALESYHKRWDDKNRVYSQHPCHDWSSHAADAMRYSCTAIQDFVLENSGSLTPDKLRKLRMESRGIKEGFDHHF